MRIWLAAALVALTSFSLASAAQAAGIQNAVLSTEQGASDSVTSFAVDTPHLYFSTDLTDVASGAKVTVSWVSVDSHGVAPANYVIDKVDLVLTDNQNHVDSDISKPNAGWPVGTYRVDVTIDGTAVDAVDFEVK